MRVGEGDMLKVEGWGITLPRDHIGATIFPPDFRELNTMINEHIAECVLEPMLVSDSGLGLFEFLRIDDEHLKENHDVVHHGGKVPYEDGSVVTLDTPLQPQARQRDVFVQSINKTHPLLVHLDDKSRKDRLTFFCRANPPVKDR